MVAAAMVVGAGATMASGAMSASAAGDAAEGQQQSAAQSNALQRYMYDTNVGLQMPTINAGNAARNRLLYGLGLSPTGTSGGVGSAPALTYDSLRQQLTGQFTRYGPAPGAGVFNAENLGISDRIAYERIKNDPVQRAAFEASRLGSPVYTPGNGSGNDGVHADEMSWGQPQNVGTLDEAGLDAEIRRRLAEQDAAIKAAEEAARNDPNYGRLAREYVPQTFSFSNEEFFRDPSYQFRLEQGQKAIDRAGLAAGRFLSGRQLQASSDYNQGAASQEYGAAYGRAANTFGINEGNRFGAYQANFNNTVNPLLSLAGAATLGSQNLGSAGAAYAGAVGNNLQGAANASGAAGIAGANAIGGGITGAVNGYQQNQLLNSLMNRGAGGVNNNPYAASGTPAYGNNSFWAGSSGMGD